MQVDPSMVVRARIRPPVAFFPIHALIIFFFPFMHFSFMRYIQLSLLYSCATFRYYCFIYALHLVIIVSFMRRTYSLFMHATYSQLMRPTHLLFVHATCPSFMHCDHSFFMHCTHLLFMHYTHLSFMRYTHSSIMYHTHLSIMRYTHRPIMRCTHSLFMSQPCSLESP